MNEGKRKIGYQFIWDCAAIRRRRIVDLYKELKENYAIDEARYYFAINVESETDYEIQMLRDFSSKEFDGFMTFGTIRDFFELKFNAKEYNVFIKYVEEFNDRVNSLVAYKAVVIPTEIEINKFKISKMEMLKSIDYLKMLPSNIHQGQKIILRRNFVERELYRAMFGDSNYADSFISSEWNYSVFKATGALEQTGIVVGYFKSIEQLLYSVLKLSINKNKIIRMKSGVDDEFISDKEEYVNTTLGSLTRFIKNNGDVLEVNSYLKRYIVDMLYKWTDEDRNGYLHKDNLYNLKKVDEIRAQTFLLYFMILGGFKIADENFTKLGILRNNNTNILSEDDLYIKFVEWITSVIIYDVPDDADIIQFGITNLIGLPLDISLRALTTTVEKDSKWDTYELFSTFIPRNNFCWNTELKTGEFKNELALAINLIERFISDNSDASKKLNSFQSIYLSGMELYKIFKE